MREPEGVTVVRWRCVNVGCRKGYADRSRARRHAATCGKDPANRSCLTCVNFVPGYNAPPEEGGGATAINDGLAELDVEMVNAGTSHGVLVVKRRGKGDPGEWLAVRKVKNDPEIGGL